MLSIAELGRHAMSLDGVREKSCAGLLRWYVDNRLVARQLDRGSVVIRSDFPDRERLLQRHPATFTVPPRFERHMMVVVELGDADADAVACAIESAWRLQRRTG